MAPATICSIRRRTTAGVVPSASAMSISRLMSDAVRAASSRISSLSNSSEIGETDDSDDEDMIF